MKALQTQTPQQNLYVQAYLGSKMSKMASEVLLEHVLKIIQLTYSLKGQTINQHDLSFQGAVLVGQILGNYPSLTLDELKIAFKKGVLGEYGDYIGLNIVTYNHWIKQYLQHHDRIKTLMQYHNNKQLKPAQPEPNAQQKLQIMKNAVLRLYNQYQTHNHCNDNLNTVYDFLKNHHALPYSSQQLWQFYHMAKEQLQTQLAEKIKTHSSLERLSLRNQLHDIINETNKTKIISAAKKICINHFFSTLHTTTQLEILLDSITQYNNQ